jgi:hypothetical protein
VKLSIPSMAELEPPHPRIMEVRGKWPNELVYGMEPFDSTHGATMGKLYLDSYLGSFRCLNKRGSHAPGRFFRISKKSMNRISPTGP